MSPYQAYAQFGYDPDNAYLYPHYIPGDECGDTTTGALPNEGSALGLTYPELTNEAEVIANLNKYLADYNARRAAEGKRPSPWPTIGDGNFAQWLFDQSKRVNINPLLIASMGKQENGFGSSSEDHVVNYYNYFGHKGTTPIDIPGSTYRGFNSPTEAMIFAVERVAEKIYGPDRTYYEDVTNFYEYLSVHQRGGITYPGEPLGNTGPTGEDAYDPQMGAYISWTTTDHPNDDYDGQLFNPGIYYSNSVAFINDLTGGNFSDIPTDNARADFTEICGFNSDGSGLVNAEGYAFPLAPQTQQVGGISIGQTNTTHHDETAAYDLFSSNSAAVYAIYDGIPVTINRAYHGIEGCSSIQFLSDDGFYYWYGHLKNVTAVEGVHVDAGDQMAQIADSSGFNSECWGGEPHLHIDRGCSISGVPQRGGRDECRDPDFIPFLSNLYENLPPG